MLSRKYRTSIYSSGREIVPDVPGSGPVTIVPPGMIRAAHLLGWNRHGPLLSLKARQGRLNPHKCWVSKSSLSSLYPTDRGISLGTICPHPIRNGCAPARDGSPITTNRPAPFRRTVPLHSFVGTTKCLTPPPGIAVSTVRPLTPSVTPPAMRCSPPNFAERACAP